MKDQIVMLLLGLLIALGGWTSANYAALACTALPICEGAWHERLDFAAITGMPLIIAGVAVINLWSSTQVQ